MANLIITVIAIALVAVASLMGAYYGGSAFLNNQAAAGASTVLNQGQQVVGAWSAYLGDNLNTPPSALTSLVTGKYLASIPVAPPAPGNNGSATKASSGTAVYVATISATGHYYMWADVGVPSTGATGGTAADNNAAACNRIVKTAAGQALSGSTAFTATAPGSIASSTTFGNGTFGCTETTVAPSGGLSGSGLAPSAGDYTLEYLVQ